jgi:hypothetical protein
MPAAPIVFSRVRRITNITPIFLIAFRPGAGEALTWDEVIEATRTFLLGVALMIALVISLPVPLAPVTYPPK